MCVRFFQEIPINCVCGVYNDLNKAHLKILTLYILHRKGPPQHSMDPGNPPFGNPCLS